MSTTTTLELCQVGALNSVLIAYGETPGTVDAGGGSTAFSWPATKAIGYDLEIMRFVAFRSAVSSSDRLRVTDDDDDVADDATDNFAVALPGHKPAHDDDSHASGM